MEKFETLILTSVEETKDIGKKIIKLLPKGVNLIILKGEIGSGKTSIVKGIASSMNITDEITSPTFGYKKTYKGLVHFDLFLAKKMNSKELWSLISEDLEENLVVIEWGEKLPKIKNSLLVTIKVITETVRKVSFKLK